MLSVVQLPLGTWQPCEKGTRPQVYSSDNWCLFCSNEGFSRSSAARKPVPHSPQHPPPSKRLPRFSSSFPALLQFWGCSLQSSGGCHAGRKVQIFLVRLMPPFPRHCPPRQPSSLATPHPHAFKNTEIDLSVLQRLGSESYTYLPNILLFVY